MDERHKSLIIGFIIFIFVVFGYWAWRVAYIHQEARLDSCPNSEILHANYFAIPLIQKSLNCK